MQVSFDLYKTTQVVNGSLKSKSLIPAYSEFFPLSTHFYLSRDALKITPTLRGLNNNLLFSSAPVV